MTTINTDAVRRTFKSFCKYSDNSLSGFGGFVEEFELEPVDPLILEVVDVEVLVLVVSIEVVVELTSLVKQYLSSPYWYLQVETDCEPF